MTGLIYKCTNLKTEKIYVGQTIVGLKNRKERHLRDSRSGSSKKLHTAIREYGEENFKWEIIEDNVQQKDILKRESYYIFKYDLTNCGYNMTPFNNDTFLTDNDVLEIISLLQNTENTMVKISKKFNCSQAHIGQINKGIKRRVEGIVYPARVTGKRSSLCPEACLEIIYLLRNTKMSQKEISEMFNILRKTITDINNGKSHRFLSDEEYPIRKTRIDNSVEKQESVIKMILEGKTNVEITKLLNVTPSDINYINNGRVNSVIKNKYNFPIRKMNKHTNKDHVEKICLEILNTKKSLKQIALEFDMKYGTIKSLNSGRNHKDVLEKLNIVAPIRKK